MDGNWLLHALPWIQVGISCLLIVFILLQRSEAGLGTAFGDSSDAVSRTRRGGEMVLFRATIILAILFAAFSLAALLLK